MEKIKFDSGVKEYRLGCGVLRFHPGDPNLYARFMESGEKMQELEKRLCNKADALEKTDTAGMAQLMRSTDLELKALLGWVFGPENDFDKLLGGVSLLAVAENGRRVITNLLDALKPVLEAGAAACARQQVQAAVAKAKSRRAAQ